MLNSFVIATLGFAILVASFAMWFRAIRNVAIPDNRLGFVAMWLAAFLLGVSSFFLPETSWLSAVPASLAVLGGGLFLVLYALSRQGEDNPVVVGDAVPTFSAIDDTGKVIESADLAGQPVLFKFFRGHW